MTLPAPGWPPPNTQELVLLSSPRVGGDGYAAAIFDRLANEGPVSLFPLNEPNRSTGQSIAEGNGAPVA